MTKKLAEVKQALADKYTRLSKTVSSKVRRKKYMNRAAGYQRQVQEAQRN